MWQIGFVTLSALLYVLFSFSLLWKGRILYWSIYCEVTPKLVRYHWDEISFNVQVATIAWLEADSVCGSHSIGIPLVLVFPYVCRLFQCLRQYKDTKEKTTLFNGNDFWFFHPSLTACYLKLSFGEFKNILAILLFIFQINCSQYWFYRLGRSMAVNGILWFCWIIVEVVHINMWPVKNTIFGIKFSSHTWEKSFKETKTESE